MKIVDKSICLAHKLFPKVYVEKKLNSNFHFAFGFHGKKLIGIGINDYALNNKALKLAKRFNIEEKKQWPTLHAETDLISQLFGRYHIDNSLTIIAVRLNRFHKLQMSKPCSSCSSVLKALNVSNVYWSDQNGEIQHGL